MKGRSLVKGAWFFLVLLLVLTGCASKEKQEGAASESKSPSSPSSSAAAKKSGEVYIYLVRHGKTMFNTTGQVQGWSDTPLTEKGVLGAKQVAIGLRDIPFVKAYSSDLGRARTTAKYILEAGQREGLALTELEGLREWNYGGYEGKTNQEMWDPIFTSQGLKFDENWTQYGELTQKLSDREISNLIAANDPTKTAENYDQITDRTKNAMERIVTEAEASGGGNVLAVSHGGEIATILELLVPGQYKGEDIGNCSVTIVKYADGGYTLETVGDTSYLKKGEEALKQ